MEIVQEHGLDLPGVIVEAKPLRAYPHGQLAAHLLGYLGEITEEDLRRPESSGYRSGSLIGKTGLERLFEEKLRGEDGYRLIEVNVRGRELRQMTTQKPVPGQRLILTLDAKVQAAGEKAFGEQAGAAVALDVRNGDVLALVSRPAFDPAQFARGINAAEWKALVENPRHPMTEQGAARSVPARFDLQDRGGAGSAGGRGGVSPETTVSCSGGISPRFPRVSLLEQTGPWRGRPAPGAQGELRRLVLPGRTAARHRPDCRHGASTRPGAAGRFPLRRRPPRPDPRPGMEEEAFRDRLVRR